MEVQDDGTVWAGADGDDLKILRIRDDRERVYATARGLPRATVAWGSEVTGIDTTPDGHTWVGVSAADAKRPSGLLRFDGQCWCIVRPLGRGIDTWVEGVATAPDGTLCVYLIGKAAMGDSPKRHTAYLARRDDSGWTVFDEEDGVPQQGPWRANDIESATLMRAGPGGTVWLAGRAGRGCPGLSSFDDAGSRSHLPDGACVHELEVAPDGTAWISVTWTREFNQAHWRDGLYRYRAGVYLVEP